MNSLMIFVPFRSAALKQFDTTTKNKQTNKTLPLQANCKNLCCSFTLQFSPLFCPKQRPTLPAVSINRRTWTLLTQPLRLLLKPAAWSSTAVHHHHQDLTQHVAPHLWLTGSHGFSHQSAPTPQAGRWTSNPKSERYLDGGFHLVAADLTAVQTLSYYSILKMSRKWILLWKCSKCLQAEWRLKLSEEGETVWLKLIKVEYCCCFFFLIAKLKVTKCFLKAKVAILPQRNKRLAKQ